MIHSLDILDLDIIGVKDVDLYIKSNNPNITIQPGITQYGWWEIVDGYTRGNFEVTLDVDNNGTITEVEVEYAVVINWGLDPDDDTSVLRPIIVGIDLYDMEPKTDKLIHDISNSIEVGISIEVEIEFII